MCIRDSPWTTDFIIDNDMIHIEDMDDIFVPRNPTRVEEVLFALLDMLAGVNLEDVESPEFPVDYDYSEEQVKMLLEANKRVKELTDSIKMCIRDRSWSAANAGDHIDAKSGLSMEKRKQYGDAAIV